MPSSVEHDRLAGQIRTFTIAYLATLLGNTENVALTIDVTQAAINIDMKFLLTVECAKMIGNHGKTVNGYRRLIYGVAINHGIPRVNVILIDPQGRGSGDDQPGKQTRFSKAERRPLGDADESRGNK